jgi:uncharacterized protein (DUF427 family)
MAAGGPSRQEIPMKIPGPDHPMVRAKAVGHVIADTDDALMLKEASYKEAAYFPASDVETGFLTKTGRKTMCPYKGEASYYSLHIEGRIFENAVWSYEDPYPAMEAIRGRLAFYPDTVEVYALDAAD